MYIQYLYELATYLYIFTCVLSHTHSEICVNVVNFDLSDNCYFHVSVLHYLKLCKLSYLKIPKIQHANKQNTTFSAYFIGFSIHGKYTVLFKLLHKVLSDSDEHLNKHV